MGVYIGQPVVISDMQGPAPEGFHVPLQSEWQAIKDIWIALGGGGSDGTNFGITLKLPFAGSRSGSSAGVRGQGTDGSYWSSSRRSTTGAYGLNFGSTALTPQYASHRAYGFSVRCFKNSPVVPTSSWTKLYGTSIERGGIFWSSTDGLISMSSDGQTWITIADKNLGATQVRNSGDTLSEANCGKYYQRGNNYGFPRTGTIANQSTTQVDASAYGPGNYYSSDIFIKYNGRWDTTDNANLRGGVSQGSTTKSVELKNAYIGEVWTPGANTIAYFPLIYDFNDYMGNYDMTTKAGSPSITTLNGVKCLYLNGSSDIGNNNLHMTVIGSTFTICGWVYCVGDEVPMLTNTYGTGSMTVNGFGVSLYTNGNGFGAQSSNNSTITQIRDNITYQKNKWYFVCCTSGSGSVKGYINGTQTASSNVTPGLSSSSYARIGGSNFNDNRGERYFGNGYVSNVIIENKVRTADEIVAYYNLTKSNYESNSGGGGHHASGAAIL